MNFRILAQTLRLLLGIGGAMPLIIDASAAEPLSTGGSNYIAVNLDSARLRSEPDAWKNSSIFKSPICQYGTESATVERDLSALFANGQRRLALVLWHARFDSTSDCGGFLLNSRGGKLSDNAVHGLTSIVDKATTIGFQEIHLRFAPMSINDPKHWSEWKEDLYQENVAVIQQVYDVVKQRNTKIVFDLGLELGGLSANATLARYVTATWNRFCPLKSEQISFMNSIAAAPGRVSRYLDWLKNTSCNVGPLFLDVYGGAKSRIENAAAEAHQAGVSRPQLVIEETYYADPDEFQDLKIGPKSSGADLLYVMQWPVTKETANTIVATTPKYLYGPH